MQLGTSGLNGTSFNTTVDTNDQTFANPYYSQPLGDLDQPLVDAANLNDNLSGIGQGIYNFGQFVGTVAATAATDGLAGEFAFAGEATDEAFLTAAAENTSLPASETWGNPDTLADHFARHGDDFNATSADDYANQASQFLQDSQSQGLPTKIDANGTIRVYDPESNTFGSYNADGTTKTFYQPDPAEHPYPTNLDYWNAQPGISPTIIGGN